jgi:nucleoside-diphosphate-sugar epimerase
MWFPVITLGSIITCASVMDYQKTLLLRFLEASMNIIVTGGSGHTGKSVVKHLLEHTSAVRIADQNPPLDDRTPYTLCDLEDFGQVVAALKGADAIVHLAAIPRPTFHPSHVVFRTNVLAAYNVFEAAATLGIERVIYASSISITGYPFYERFFEPLYVPIDEEHPAAPQDAYGLSKYLGEEIGRQVFRTPHGHDGNQPAPALDPHSTNVPQRNCTQSG